MIQAGHWEHACPPHLLDRCYNHIYRPSENNIYRTILAQTCVVFVKIHLNFNDTEYTTQRHHTNNRFNLHFTDTRFGDSKLGPASLFKTFWEEHWKIAPLSSLDTV